MDDPALHDLGSLQVPASAGELRARLEGEGPVEILCQDADWTLALSAYAAPAGRDVLPGTAAAIASALEGQLSPDGEVIAHTDHGEGPAPVLVRLRTHERAFVREVYTGPAGADPAPPTHLRALADAVRVQRGSAPHPPGTLLPLRLPTAAASDQQLEAPFTRLP